MSLHVKLQMEKVSDDVYFRSINNHRELFLVEIPINGKYRLGTNICKG